MVYAEFLASFFPLFFLFLGICQFTLMTSARVIVGQAANQAVRSAVVVLEDSPEHYDSAARRDLSAGSPNSEESIEQLVTTLDQADEKDPPSSPDRPQQGARMTPVRTAAYAPLLTITPNAKAWSEEASVRGGVHTGFLSDMEFLHRVRARSFRDQHSR